MRSSRHRARLWSLALLGLAACGGEAESTPATPPNDDSAPATESPADTLSTDSLYGATALDNLRTVPVVIDASRLPEGWSGMRIAAISDMVLGLWPDNEEVATEAVRRAVAAEPDLTVLLGDYVTTLADTATLARVLEPLRGRPVMAVMGDRDLQTAELEAAVTRTLTRHGIRVLQNDAVPFTHRNATALVGGLSPRLVNRPFAERRWVLSTLGGKQPIPLLLTHIPPLAVGAPPGRFAAILAGNTFCGQVEVPGTPRLSWLNSEVLQEVLVPGTERLYQLENNTMFVTCGVGYNFIPVRLGAPPEIAMVTLQQVTAGAEMEISAPTDTAVPDSLLDKYLRRDTADQ